jgi:vacuolar-type H+-ATPase subunit D/Vma8
LSNAQDLMRLRFHELRAQIAAVEAVSGPLRQKRDAIHAKAQAIVDTATPLDAQILGAEAGLYEAKNELAMLSRALGGQTALGGEAAVDA